MNNFLTLIKPDSNVVILRPKTINTENKMKRLFILFVATGMLYGCSNNPQTPAEENQATDENAQINENQMVIETDMENVAALPAYWINGVAVEKMDKIPAHSGNYAVKVDAKNMYSLTFRENFANINAKLPKRVVVNGWYYFPEPNEKSGIVMEINENGNKIIWKAYNIYNEKSVTNQWAEFTAYFSIDKPITPEQQIKIFANSGNKIAYFDDFKIIFEY